jgi:hypothetical protein
MSLQFTMKLVGVKQECGDFFSNMTLGNLSQWPHEISAVVMDLGAIGDMLVYKERPYGR